MTALAPPVPRAPATAVADAATWDTVSTLRAMHVDAAVGVTDDLAGRLARSGPNAVTSHRARVLPALGHQLASPLLGLLVVAAVVSAAVGERGGAATIAVVVVLSVGLGFGNEYRAERAAQALHDQVHHTTVVLRDGRRQEVDVTGLVPGDLVDIALGDVVPADLRLLDVTGLECDESVLTGESVPAIKDTGTVPAGTPLAELTGCALMGTVVAAGSGHGIVVATGAATEFGGVAVGLDTHPLDTRFQVGLRSFSVLLAWVAVVLTTAVLVVNVALGRPLLDAVLFSLAIAVGITPQLLPAVVSSSLAAGSRRLSRRHVLVKRLVCIEDLGDVDVLLTDKTGTLTEGRPVFLRAVPTGDDRPEDVLRWGLRATETTDGTGGNALDRALRAAEPAGSDDAVRLALLPFDHERRLVSALVRTADGTCVVVTKGAPEAVLDRCVDVPSGVAHALAAEFAAGNRVVAVATRTVPGGHALTVDDEHGLTVRGLLVASDPPKDDAADALSRLADLGITVKVVTGDAAPVAVHVCRQLGLGDTVLTGADLAVLDDDELAAALATTSVFARVSPQDKARIVAVQRRTGGGVAFLGDGVNDALALHGADVGISVESATDVAKDAADVILLEKDLGVLADGVTEGRRIFVNTIKYVLMGTSSNVGNMASAAGASLFLGFLPMLPSQILLNNLLYDTSQLAIPTDRADDEQVRRPAHWDIAFIRRFMLVFGPLSSLFDALTFVVLLTVLHAGPTEFRTGWFVESLATQTLVVLAIRTRRVPFWRSRPSLPLVLAAVGVVAVGAVLPATPLARSLGFTPLPAVYYLVLVGFVVGYLLLIEVGKAAFYATASRATAVRPRDPHRHLRRRAARFSVVHRSTR
ncbi:magnesium-translocating P-type ATPase [Klenkia terrae]|uniref:Magnesium-transporting ATPase, P-type 1 n=1 Tax=Klenkia terrae TaxID=1052259 RepID=A0ABU8E7Q6_9ACTN|nr:magnesium-translocating P-type ATPase [Klenkia terrae]SSC26016.1 P-type ATPase [Klenkia terrae]